MATAIAYRLISFYCQHGAKAMTLSCANADGEYAAAANVSVATPRARRPAAIDFYIIESAVIKRLYLFTHFALAARAACGRK